MKIVSTWMKIHFQKKEGVELMWNECIFSSIPHPTLTQVDKVWIFIWKPPCFHHRHLHDVCIYFLCHGIREQFFSVKLKQNKLYNGYLWQGCCFLLLPLFSFSQSSLIPPTYDSTQFSSSCIFHFEHLMRKSFEKSCYLDALDCFIFTAW